MKDNAHRTEGHDEGKAFMPPLFGYVRGAAAGGVGRCGKRSIIVRLKQEAKDRKLGFESERSKEDNDADSERFG